MVCVQRLVRKGNSALSQAVIFAVLQGVFGASNASGADVFCELTAIEFVAFFLGLDWLAGLARRATYFSLAIAKET
jgi:hypothetical protein